MPNPPYFAPEAPKGKEKNWLASVPGKGYFVILRLYGPGTVLRSVTDAGRHREGQLSVNVARLFSQRRPKRSRFHDPSAPNADHSRHPDDCHDC
jgi:hypothetical protein